MPVYYFDTLIDGGKLVRDEEGYVLADDEVARQLGQAALLDMARDAMPGEDSASFGVAVRNHAKVVVYTAEMTITGRWLWEADAVRPANLA